MKPAPSLQIVADASAYRRILLTGGTGFVGPYLLEALARAYPGAERRVLVRAGEANPSPAWTPVAADIVSEAEVGDVVRRARPDLVLHLAAQASAAQSIAEAESTWRVNFRGSFNLAAAIARHAPNAVVLFVSTADVYGATLREGPATEATLVSPLTAYGRSKAAAEAMLADVLAPTNRLIVARPFNHIGPGQDRRFALPSFAAQIAAIERGELLPLVEVGDLSVLRDFLDVRDVVDAYLRLVAAAARLPARSVFNIASGNPRSLASLLELMRLHATKYFEIVVDARRLRPSETPVSVGDASKLRAVTGWRPAYQIDDTLVALLDFWRGAAEDSGVAERRKDEAR
jgi:GDP-4-dehydro-6-deoxy-D-mannose reductase